MRTAKHTKEIRKNRIKNIYEEVLSKAGENTAKILYRQYFPESSQTIDVTELSQEMEQKKRKLLSDKINIIVHAPKDAIEANNPAFDYYHYTSLRTHINKERRTPTSMERQKRIKSYGRWYLKPAEFSAKINVNS